MCILSILLDSFNHFANISIYDGKNKNILGHVHAMCDKDILGHALCNCACKLMT